MAPLKIIFGAALLCVSTTSNAQSVDRWRPFIVEASARFGVPAGWIERVMQVESGGRTFLGGRPIVSRAGAIGLMQVMPATWVEMRLAHGLGRDPRDPHDNIIAGTAYLRAMYDRFGYPALFAAYNAGPGRYAAYLAGQATLPAETRSYLVEVAGNERPPSIRRPERGPAALFVPLVPIPRPSNARSAPERPSTLFIPLSTSRPEPGTAE